MASLSIPTLSISERMPMSVMTFALNNIAGPSGWPALVPGERMYKAVLIVIE